MRPLIFGSLFAGIAGLDLGLERAGMRCAWQVEKDDYAARVLERRYPGVLRRRDVCDSGIHNLTPVDVIAGGFPCQDISASGPRVGIDGARSGLWREFARIVGELRPRYVIVENVADLIYRGLKRVLGDLAALGFDAEWEIVPACAFGAPHTRERLFILAYSQPAEWGPFSAARRYVDNSRNRVRFAGAQTPDGATRGHHQMDGGGWASEPNVGRVADGVPARMDRLSGLGNAVSPVVGEFVGRCVMAHAQKFSLL